MPVSMGMRPFVCHTATMRGRYRPSRRQATAALVAAGGLILAGCGGSNASHHHSAKAPSHEPSASPTAVAEPTSGQAAVAAITANWKTVFDGKVAIPSRLALVQDGPQIAAFVDALAKTTFGKAAVGSTATVSSVTVTSPSRATVEWELLLLGTPLLKKQAGTAVYLNGVWKVGITSFCGLAYLEYPKTSPKLPAVCRN
jgi:hypothetical protein